MKVTAGSALRSRVSAVLALAIVFGVAGARRGDSAAAAESAAPSAESSPPKKVGLRESAGIRLIQLEVTVWPKSRDAAACAGLTADDFELKVNGKDWRIYAVDPLAPEEEIYGKETGTIAASASAGTANARDSAAQAESSRAPRPGSTVRSATGDTASQAGSASGTATAVKEQPSTGPGGGLSVVLFFDLWHIDLFYKDFIACPPTKHLAFEGARRFVREGFQDGDRLLLVTAAGWPIIHYGWIRTRTEALRALDRLEKDHQVMMPRQTHANHLGWIQGMESLFLALGRYPGRKDVMYFADDFRFDDVAMRMYEIAGRAQANGVVVNAVDLVDSCRKIWGPGPKVSCDHDGGLGCTEFSEPIALGPLSLETGGQLFRTDRVDAALNDLRAMRRCRYVVSFRYEAAKGKKIPSVVLSLKENRKGLTLLAPSSFEAPGRTPSQKEKDEALFLLPRFGRGVTGEVMLWPYKPEGKKKQWKAFILAKVEVMGGEALPDDLSTITVNAIAHADSEIYGQFRKTITGEDLARFRSAGGTRLLLFPLERISPGETPVDLTVTSNLEEVAASARNLVDVPEPPGPGEVRPWFLSDRTVHFGQSEVLAPAFEDVIPAGRTFSIIGFGCRNPTDQLETYDARLVPFSGGEAVTSQVSWLAPPQGSGAPCGWLVARIGPDLPAGLWTFEPPAQLAGKSGDAPALELNVVPEESSPAAPADAPPVQ